MYEYTGVLFCQLKVMSVDGRHPFKVSSISHFTWLRAVGKAEKTDFPWRWKVVNLKRERKIMIWISFTFMHSKRRKQSILRLVWVKRHIMCLVLHSFSRFTPLLPFQNLIFFFHVFLINGWLSLALSSFTCFHLAQVTVPSSIPSCLAFLQLRSTQTLFESQDVSSHLWKSSTLILATYQS